MTAGATDTRTKGQRRIVRVPSPLAVEAVARVRRELRIESLADIDVVLIGAHYGLVPLVRDLENEEAHVISAGSRGVVCIARRLWESGAWRFAYAHEVGHWLHDRGHDDFARITAQGKTSARRSHESFANDFAGLLLVPGDVVTARWDLDEPDLGTVQRVAEACSVSVATAAIRVLQLTRAPRAVAMSRAGRVEWWAETAAFGARVRAGRAVPAGSAAARLHRAACARLGESGEAWDAGVAGSAVRLDEEDGVVSWLG